MDTTATFVTLWIASGAFLGGVVTPVVASRRRFNDWVGMALGLALGAVGNVILLAPLWAFVSAQPRLVDTRPEWQLDAQGTEVVPAAPVVAGEETAQQSWMVVVELAKKYFWPAERPHSHRMEYVAVAVALAIITAVEVAITYAGLPFSVTGPLVALSTTKVLLVALFFMHLRYDSRWYAAIFAFGFPFAFLIITILALV